jgi:hypothetical protein
MPKVSHVPAANFFGEHGEVHRETFSQDAYSLAACQRVGTRTTEAKRLNLFAHFWELGLLGTGDAELLHPKLQRWALHPKFRGRSVRPCEDPVGLLKDR